MLLPAVRLYHPTLHIGREADKSKNEQLSPFTSVKLDVASFLLFFPHFQP